MPGQIIAPVLFNDRPLAPLGHPVALTRMATSHPPETPGLA